MKTYILIISRSFPVTHIRAGEPTHFIYKIEKALGIRSVGNKAAPKIHTIRSNYPLWKERFEQIKKGEACLSLRYWEGKPYRSKQIEFAKLTKEDGIGIQRLDLSASNGLLTAFFVPDKTKTGIKLEELSTLALNDGLSINDFKEWFMDYDMSQPVAIIHFTSFRY